MRYSVQEGQVLFSLFSLSPPADRLQLTASSVELAQLGREAKQSLSGGRSRLVRAAQELPELRAADAQVMPRSVESGSESETRFDMNTLSAALMCMHLCRPAPPPYTVTSSGPCSWSF